MKLASWSRVLEHLVNHIKDPNSFLNVRFVYNFILGTQEISYK